MKEEKRISNKDLLIIALITCIVSSSIAYATISTTLVITNNLSIKAHNWDIHFENLQQETITGNNSAEIIKNAVIEKDTTKITGLDVSLKKPGDFVSYTFDIKNDGEINARLTTLNIGTPICNPDSLICKDIEYTLKYANGSDIKVTDMINKGQLKKVKLTIKYKETSTQSTDVDVNVNGLDATFVYTQE